MLNMVEGWSVGQLTKLRFQPADSCACCIVWHMHWAIPPEAVMRCTHGIKALVNSCSSFIKSLLAHLPEP